MTITTYKNTTFQDLVSAVNYLLGVANNSPEVKQLATQITTGTDDPIRAIYDFVWDNMYYVPDPEDSELFTSPVKLIRDYNQGASMQGDCDDFAIFITALFRAINLNSHVSFVSEKNNDYDHAISEVWSDSLGQFIQIDTSTSKKLPLGWYTQYNLKYDIT